MIKKNLKKWYSTKEREQQALLGQRIREASEEIHRRTLHGNPANWVVVGSEVAGILNTTLNPSYTGGYYHGTTITTGTNNSYWSGTTTTVGNNNTLLRASTASTMTMSGTTTFWQR
jgi:hypothetical protein